MRQFIDHDLRGQVVLLDRPSEALKPGYARYQTSHRAGRLGGDWEGRKFSSHEEVLTAFERPWEHGLKVMGEFRQKLDRELPSPKSVRRTQTWNEDRGAVCVNRYLAGDPVMFRETRRLARPATRNVAILCNTAEMQNSPAEYITWRGAAAVAATDLLEEAGYSVEFWIWHRVGGFFRGASPEYFMASRVKSCGDPLDVDVLINSISSWFFRMACIGLMASPDMRYGQRCGEYGTGYVISSIGDYTRHLDVQDNIAVLHMPSVTSPDAATRAALKLLDQATKESE